MLNITGYTIAAANTAQKLTGATALTPVCMFGVQNQHASANLLIKTESTNGTTNVVTVEPSQFLLLGPAVSAANVYDLNSVYVQSGTISHPYSVTKVVA